MNCIPFVLPGQAFPARCNPNHVNPLVPSYSLPVSETTRRYSVCPGCATWSFGTCGTFSALCATSTFAALEGASGGANRVSWAHVEGHGFYAHERGQGLRDLGQRCWGDPDASM